MVSVFGKGPRLTLLKIRYIQGDSKKKNRRLFTTTTNRLRASDIPKGRQFFGDYVCQVWWHLMLSSFDSVRKTGLKIAQKGGSV